MTILNAIYSENDHLRKFLFQVLIRVEILRIKQNQPQPFQ